MYEQLLSLLGPARKTKTKSHHRRQRNQQTGHQILPPADQTMPVCDKQKPLTDQSKPKPNGKRIKCEVREIGEIGDGVREQGGESGDGDEEEVVDSEENEVETETVAGIQVLFPG